MVEIVTLLGKRMMDADDRCWNIRLTLVIAFTQSGSQRKLRHMIAVLMVFGIVGFLGLLAAKRPHVFVRYVLADWQRERLEGNMAAVSWTGWIIFGCAAFTLAVMLIAGAAGR
jgi:hypothetical protein